MQKLIALCIVFQSMAICGAWGWDLYNIDFEAPTHVPGQAPATGGASNTPSTVVFGDPRVESGFGDLQSQSLVFNPNVGTQEQIKLNLGKGVDNYQLSLDMETAHLNRSLYLFKVILDTPEVRNVNFHGQVGFYVYVPVHPIFEYINSFEDGEPIHLHLDIDLQSHTWSGELNGDLAFTGAFPGTDVYSIRMSLSPCVGGAGIDPTVNVAVDNILVTTGVRGIYADGTLPGGTEAELAGPHRVIDASASTTVGDNLFGSFASFSLKTGESVRFTGPAGVQNVIVRGTGDTATVIGGLLNSDLAGADTYLISPRGVVVDTFDQATLGGGLFLSTADYVRFTDQATFGADSHEPLSLSSAAPSALGFQAATGYTRPVEFLAGGLSVGDGKMIVLAGEGVRVGDASTIGAILLDAPEGRIWIASVRSAGELRIGAPFDCDVSPFAALGDVTIRTNQGQAYTSLSVGKAGGGAGCAVIAGDNVTLDRTRIMARVEGTGPAGQVAITGTGAVSLRDCLLDGRAFGASDGSGLRLTAAGDAALSRSVLCAGSDGAGRGGDIHVDVAGSLSLTDASAISSLAGGGGNGGDLDIDAGALQANGTGAFLSVASGAGTGGAIQIDAVAVALTGDSVVRTETWASADGGSVTIEAAGDITLAGSAAPVVSTHSFGADASAGRAGDILIRGTTVSLLDGARVLSQAAVPGRQGRVSLDASERITFVVGTNQDWDFDGIVSGTASLRKLGSGVLTLSDDNTYTGDTVIEAGGLLVNGHQGSPVAVAAGAALGGTGTVGTLTNAGRVTPGNSIGVLTVNGDYTQGATGVLVTELDPVSGCDRLDVTGDVTLDGGTLELVSMRGATAVFDVAKPQSILTAGGTVTGRFDNVAENLALYDPIPFYAEHDIALRLLRVPTDFSSSPLLAGNRHAVARRLDDITAAKPGLGGNFGRWVDTLSLLSDEARAAAFGDLTGELHANVPLALAEAHSGYASGVARRLMDLRAPEDGAPGTGAPNSMWAAICQESIKHDETEGVAGFQTNTYGPEAGIGRFLDRHLWLGIGGGQFRSHLELDGSRPDDAEVSSDYVGGFGRYSMGDTTFIGSAVYSHSDTEASRRVRAGDITGTAHSDYSAHLLSLGAEGGHTFRLKALELQPTVSVLYTSVWREAFTESGADSANLHADSARYQRVRATAGGQARFAWASSHGSGCRLAPRLLWNFDLTAPQPELDAHFAAQPDGDMRVAGVDPDRGEVRGGLGIQLFHARWPDTTLFVDGDLSLPEAQSARIDVGFRQAW